MTESTGDFDSGKMEGLSLREILSVASQDVLNTAGNRLKSAWKHLDNKPQVALGTAIALVHGAVFAGFLPRLPILIEPLKLVGGFFGVTAAVGAGVAASRIKDAWISSGKGLTT